MTNRTLLVGLLWLAPALTAAGASAGATSSTPAPPAATAHAANASEKKDSAPPIETSYLTLRVPLTEKLTSFPIAKVEAEIITAQDLVDAISTAHSSHGADAKARGKDFRPTLDRLIGGRLVVFEAREMGLDELPAYTEAVEKFKQDLLREHLKRKAIETAKPDPARVEKLYQASTRQWDLRTLHFQKPEDAAQVAELMKAGKSFEETATTLLSEKKAQGGEDPRYFSVKELLPQVLAAVEGLSPGAVSPPIKVARGYAVVKLFDLRYVDDPKARVDAEQAALLEQQRAGLAKYYDALVKRVAKIDWKLLANVDYEAKKPGIAALAKDRRVLVRFKDDKPITVADLTEAFKEQFFHGMEGAVQNKSVNAQRSRVLDVLVSRRVVPAEARRIGIPETPEYKKDVSEFVNSLLFSTYIEKVIAPDVKVTDADLRKYYDDHKREFTYPPFYKLDGMAFTDVKKAQDTLDKLRSGTDFKWLKTNADGQVKTGKSLLQFDGNTLSATSLPRDLVEALAGSKRGNHRLYAPPEGPAYVLDVVDAIESSEEPYEEARSGIREKVTAERLGKAIDDHVDHLRKARNVTVFITRIGE